MSLKMLKCVRCGSIEDLKPYAFSGSNLAGSKKIARGFYTQTYKIFVKELPVCGVCLEKFKRWDKKYGYGLCLVFLSLIIMSIGTVGAVFLRSLLWAIVLVIIGFIVMILAGWVINKDSEDKSRRYVSISWGEVKVRPENVNEWIPLQLWAEMVLKERRLLEEKKKFKGVPQEAKKHFLEGFSLMKSRKYEEALNAFNKALTIFPDFPRALSEKGAVLIEFERYQKAYRTLNRALELNPNLTSAKQRLKMKVFEPFR